METKRRVLAQDTWIAEVAGRQHGVVSRRQLIELGVRPGAIKWRLAHGRLHSVSRGVYAVGHQALSREGRWMAAVLYAGPGAVLSHRPAAAHWGFRPTARIARGGERPFLAPPPARAEDPSSGPAAGRGHRTSGNPRHHRTPHVVRPGGRPRLEARAPSRPERGRDSPVPRPPEPCRPGGALSAPRRSRHHPSATRRVEPRRDGHPERAGGAVPRLRPPGRPAGPGAQCARGGRQSAPRGRLRMEAPATDRGVGRARRARHPAQLRE